jgi:hypothetical protein
MDPVVNTAIIDAARRETQTIGIDPSIATAKYISHRGDERVTSKF